MLGFGLVLLLGAGVWLNYAESAAERDFAVDVMILGLFLFSFGVWTELT